jgi:hypothetical protein
LHLDHIARAWAELMKASGTPDASPRGRLAPHIRAMAHQAPAGCWASTSTCRRRYRPTCLRCCRGGPAPAGLPRTNARVHRLTRSPRRTGLSWM